VQVKDPIERAGVRLLWAAAIPIQNQARRFLARQHAIKRMCAVLTIQSVSKKYCSAHNPFQTSSISLIIIFDFILF